MTIALPAIISSSPRAGGNSDNAAFLFAQGVGEAQAEEAPHVTMLRRYEVLPCQACYRCEHAPGGKCYLGSFDQSGALFQMLLDSPYLFLSSPIFFYHLPARLKSFIDRGHSYWLRREHGDSEMLALPKRKAYICLIAGRQQGTKMFEGSLLTLKYFLDIFHFEMVEPLTVYGVEKADDMSSRPDVMEQLKSWGREAAQ